MINGGLCVNDGNELGLIEVLVFEFWIGVCCRVLGVLKWKLRLRGGY